MRRVALLAALLCLMALPLAAQDPVKVDPKHYTDWDPCQNLPNCQDEISPLKFARDCAFILVPRESWCLLVQDDTQEGIVNLKSACIVMNEAQFPELVHEKIDP